MAILNRKGFVSFEDLIILFSLGHKIYDIVCYFNARLLYALSENCIFSQSSKWLHHTYEIVIRRYLDLRFIVENQIIYGNGLNPLAKVMQDVCCSHLHHNACSDIIRICVTDMTCATFEMKLSEQNKYARNCEFWHVLLRSLSRYTLYL